MAMESKSIVKERVELQSVPLDSHQAFQHICCPSCDDSVPAQNININDKIAKCNHCSVVFPFEIKTHSGRKEETIRYEILKPEGIDVFQFKDELDITVQQPAMTFLLDYTGLGFSSIFALLTFFIYFISGDLSLYVPLGFTLLTMLSSIRPLNRANHKIHVSIDKQHLHIKRRPKNFFKDQSFLSSDIGQVYVKDTNGVHFEVYMIVNGSEGQRHVRLLPHTGSRSKAKYIEQQIEKYLGIADRIVLEEAQRHIS